MPLKNRIQQYRVTYDRLNQIFIVHCKENNKPNIHFIIHDSGIHYYGRAEYFTLLATVADNKKRYINQQIKAEERALELYRAVTYTSVADYRWAIHINQIKDFPATLQYIDVAISIWGKDIFSIKVNTTRKKTIPVTEDLIQVPKDIIRLHSDFIMTADIFFVKALSLFLTLSIKLLYRGTPCH